MTHYLVDGAASAIRLWTRIYTAGLPFDQSGRRRAEVDSDLWESREEASRGNRNSPAVAAEMLARLVIGLPDDLRWRYELQPPRVPTLWVEVAAAGVLFLIVILSSASMLSGRPRVDLAEAVRVESVSTGWVHRRPGSAQAALVPFVTFELRNVSDQTLAGLYVSATFRQADTHDEWGKGWTTAVRSWGLAPGSATRRLTLPLANAEESRGRSGEKGLDAERADATVEVFVRRASTPWISLATYPVGSWIVR